MDILTSRVKQGARSTLGKIYINGAWYSYCLEDQDRGLNSGMSVWEIEKIKIYGETAIPFNVKAKPHYEVALTYSQKFKATWPQLMYVPGYDGIRPHAGNYIVNTFGCPLIGSVRPGPSQDKNGYWRVWDSQKAFLPLKYKIEQAIKRNEPVTWTVKQDY